MSSKLAIRHSPSSKVYESCTRFIKMDSISLKSLSSSILAHFSTIGVNFQKLVDQSHDSASALEGHVSGAQKRI